MTPTDAGSSEIDQEIVEIRDDLARLVANAQYLLDQLVAESNTTVSALRRATAEAVTQFRERILETVAAATGDAIRESIKHGVAGIEETLSLVESHRKALVQEVERAIASAKEEQTTRLAAIEAQQRQRIERLQREDEAYAAKAGLIRKSIATLSDDAAAMGKHAAEARGAVDAMRAEVERGTGALRGLVEDVERLKKGPDASGGLRASKRDARPLLSAAATAFEKRRWLLLAYLIGSPIILAIVVYWVGRPAGSPNDAGIDCVCRGGHASENPPSALGSPRSVDGERPQSTLRPDSRLKLPLQQRASGDRLPSSQGLRERCLHVLSCESLNENSTVEERKVCERDCEKL